MNTYNISLNEELSKLVDKQMKIGCFANRSEFFRQLLRHAFLPNTKKDWIYEEPYITELNERIDDYKNGKEELISQKEFDKEFNL